MVLLAALAGGAGAFTWQATHPPPHSAMDEPELRWLQREFGLSDEAMARIAVLHRNYAAECGAMCAALERSESEVTRLMMDKRLPSELDGALRRSHELVAQCQRRMLEHFHAVAREMPPAAGEKYLAAMAPIAAQPGRACMNMTPSTAWPSRDGDLPR